MKIFKKIKTNKNIVWSTIDFATLPIGMLLATPFLIKYLGMEQFGVYILVNALVGFGSVFNFGFGDTTLKYVSQYKNANRIDRCAEIVKTVGALTLVSGISIGALFYIGAPYFSRLFNIDHLSYSNNVLYATAVIITLRLIELVYVSTLRGCYRYDLSGAPAITARILTVVVQTVLAFKGFELPALLLTTILSNLLSIAWLSVFCRREIGNVTPWFSSSVFSEIWQFSRWSWVQGLAGLLFVNIDRLMVSALLGPSALCVYGVCMQLAQNIHNCLSAASHSVFPKISMLSHEWNSEAQSKLAALYIRASRNLSIGAIFISTFMAVFSYDILRLWVGADIAGKGWLILTLLAISHGWYSCNHTITFYVLNGTGRPKVQAIVSFVGAVLITVGCAFLLPIYGLLGAALARFPDLPFRVGVRMYVGRSIVGEKIYQVSADFIRLTLVGLIVFYLCKKGMSAISEHGLLFLHPGRLFLLALTGVAVMKLMTVVEDRFGTRLY